MKTVIIGGGASGLACAVKIKQNNRAVSVTILEHLDKVGKKLYATGNGRCNLSNRHADNNADVEEFFKSIGLVMRADKEGRVYPYSNQASSVLETLVKACKKYGVEIICSCTVGNIEKVDDKFNIFTSSGIFTADNLVLATGGMAQSSLGSDGSGYALAKSFSHTITALSPALVQLKSSSKHCRALKGVRAKCNVKIEINGSDVAEEFGELLFAEYGISGIVVMDLSHYVNDKLLKNGMEKCVAVIDFVPEMTEKQLEQHYIKFGSLIGILPHKLCSILSKQTDDDASLIAKFAKNWRLIITGTKGYDFAQITNGGVSLDELDDSNQSKITPHLYITGELADKQFKCGGFNLNNAFYDGIKTANAITKANDKN